MRGEREVLLLLTRPFPRSRYRSHFRETLPFCEIIVLQTLFHVLSCVTHRKIMALSDSSSRFPFTLQGSHRNHANISPLLLLLLVPLLLLTNFEISQTPFRHPIKWRQVEWKYQIDCKQKGSMFRQEVKSFRYSKNAALSDGDKCIRANCQSRARAFCVEMN